MSAFENEDNSIVEFQLGNKQLFLLFLGLLVICAIFFFIGLRVGEDTAGSRIPFALNEQDAAQQEEATTTQPAAQTPTEQPRNNTVTPTEDLGTRPSRTAATERNAQTTDSQQPQQSQPEPETTAEKPQTSQPQTGSFYVQVAALEDINGAEKLRKRLPKSMNTSIEKVVVRGKDYFRVLIGPFRTDRQAEDARQAVLSSYKEAFIKKM